MNPLGLFLDPPGPLISHLHTVYMEYSECLPTRLNPLAERTCFSQADSAASTCWFKGQTPEADRTDNDGTYRTLYRSGPGF